MKKLLIIRHAKSSWSFPGLNDHDRPLNDRGKKDVKRMGKVLGSLFKDVQFVYCSSAKRAQETLAGLNLSQPNITLEELYTFNTDEVLRIIKKLNDDNDFIAIIGHNPALTELINETSSMAIDNLPTCGAVLLQWTDASSWKDIAYQQAKALTLITPKGL